MLDATFSLIVHYTATACKMSSVAGLQRIAPVPTSSDFIDLVLNTTMRKTPTVIHKNVREPPLKLQDL